MSVHALLRPATAIELRPRLVMLRYRECPSVRRLSAVPAARAAKPGGLVRWR